MIQRFGPNPGTWSQQLNDMLYKFDTQGVQKSIMEEAQRTLDQQSMVQMAPFLQRLYDINQSHYDAVTNIFKGNNPALQAPRARPSRRRFR